MKCIKSHSARNNYMAMRFGGCESSQQTRLMYNRNSVLRYEINNLTKKRNFMRLTQRNLWWLTFGRKLLRNNVWIVMILTFSPFSSLTGYLGIREVVVSIKNIYPYRLISKNRNILISNWSTNVIIILLESSIWNTHAWKCP